MNYTQKIKPIKESVIREVSGGASFQSLNSSLVGIFSMNTKLCKKCNTVRPTSDFYTHKELGTQHYCKDCHKRIVRDSNRTLDGLAKRIYRNQVHNSKRRGMPPPDYPIDWLLVKAIGSDLFVRLYGKWVKSGYDRMLAPSFDRIDNNRPYTRDNIQIMTWGENKGRQCKDVINGDYISRLQRDIIAIRKSDMKVFEYYSVHDAARGTDVDFRNVSACCRGLRGSGNGFTFMYKEDYDGR